MARPRTPPLFLATPTTGLVARTRPTKPVVGTPSPSSRFPPSSLCLFFFFLLLIRPALAAAPESIQATVASVSGGSVYLDRGRSSGIAIGDRVRFSLAGVGAAEGTVRAVSKSSSRVELLPGSAPVAHGVRAEIEIPEDRLRAPDTPPPTPDAPPTPATQPPPRAAPPSAGASQTPATSAAPHPPWTHPPETWNEDLPLLAPALGLAPEDRDTQWSGRTYLRWNSTFDEEGAGRSYHLGAIGLDGRLENPFHKGGALELDLEVYQRSIDLPDEGDDSSTDLLVQRLSYWQGGTDSDPTRWEVGRFLQHEFPELGLVDGFEWTRRYGSGNSRFGVAAGGIPEPFPARSTFDSLGVSLYHTWVPDDDERVSLGTAWQSTWYRGERDRDLALATLGWRATDTLSLDAGAWVDVYGSNDEVKDGVELTELRVGATQRIGDASGVGASFSHVRWPELLRREFAPSLTPEELDENQVDRASLSAWHGFSRRWRVHGRVDAWSDQDDDGTNGELGLAVRDLLWSQGEVGITAFYADGTYSSGPGARLSATRAFARGAWTLGYEWVEYDQKGFVGTQETLAHHGIYGTLDLELGERWDLSLFGDRRFGDELDGYSLGFQLSTGF